MAMNDASIPALNAMYRLQWEDAQQAWVLLYPEGMVRLNAPAAEILRRCDGRTALGDLLEDLQRAFREPDLRADVMQFLAEARGHGWLA